MADEEQKEQTEAKSLEEKEELLKAIKEDRGISEEPAVKKGTTADMKKVMLKLREQKNEARQSKDPKRVNVLRRRINRMKKRTKKIAKKA